MTFIRRLKDWIEELGQNNNVYVCLKALQNNRFIKCGILKVSKTPIGIELIIDKRISNSITIKKLKVMLDECKDEDNVSYILLEKKSDIQRGGGIEGFQIIHGHLYLTSILFPRIV